MYDNICKFLAETFSEDLASWLVGEAEALTEISASELSLEPIRADTVILRQGVGVALHCEFQTAPDPTMGFRMADYALRIYRRFPQKRLVQVVVYLRPTTSEFVYQTTFVANRLSHEFEVVRLWEQPSEVFLQRPGLYPYAVLSQTRDRVEVLRQVAQQIDGVADRRQQSNLSAATGILAGLVLERAVIQRVLRRDLMRESVIYQEWRDEIWEEARQELLPLAREEGRQAGEELGRQAGERLGQRREAVNLIMRLLTRRLRQDMSEGVREQLTRFGVEVLEELGEALLDFGTVEDLEGWVESYQMQQQEWMREIEPRLNAQLGQDIGAERLEQLRLLSIHQLEELRNGLEGFQGIADLDRWLEEHRY